MNDGNYEGEFSDFDGSNNSFKQNESLLRSLVTKLSQNCYVFKHHDGNLVEPGCLFRYDRDGMAEIIGMSEKGILHNGSVQQNLDGSFLCSISYAQVDKRHIIDIWMGRLNGLDVGKFEQLIEKGNTPEKTRAKIIRKLDELVQ